MLDAFRRMSATNAGRFGLAFEAVLSVIFGVEARSAKHPWAGLAVVAVLSAAAFIADAALRWASGDAAQDPPPSSQGLRGQARIDAMLTLPIFLIPAALIGIALRWL